MDWGISGLGKEWIVGGVDCGRSGLWEEWVVGGVDWEFYTRL